MVGHTGNDMDVLVIQYPRGRAALVWFDPVTKHISISHAGLRAILQRGVKDWGGRLLFPHDGRAFLAAVYDYLFLNGYRVRWARATAHARPTRHCN